MPINKIQVVEGLSAELQEAVGTVNIAVQVAWDAEAKAKEAKGHLRDIARRFLMAAETDEERLSRAALIYWRMPDIPAGILAAVLLGKETRTCLLGNILPPCPFTSKCSGCGADLPNANRAALSRARDNDRIGFARLCDDCSGRKRSKEEATATWEREVERQRELRTMPYREYLLTEEWLQKRNQKLKQAGFKCQLCNSTGLLNVHHRTYERRGEEWLSDLTVLCQPCHAKFHDKLPK